MMILLCELAIKSEGIRFGQQVLDYFGQQLLSFLIIFFLTTTVIIFNNFFPYRET